MFSSNLTKFFAVFACVFLFFTGCGLWSKSSAPSPSGTPAAAEILQSGIPFKTTEPERFQAEFVVRTGETERRTFVARHGPKRRIDFALDEKGQISTITAEKTSVMLQSRKIFAEIAHAGGGPDEWSDFLTTEWLSEKTDATFEKLETSENITKYRVRIGSDEASEVFIYVDEKLGIPVRQEYFAVGGENRTLTYSFEIKNLRLEADDALFAVPADFRKVSTDEFYKTLRSSDK